MYDTKALVNNIHVYLVFRQSDGLWFKRLSLMIWQLLFMSSGDDASRL